VVPYVLIYVIQHLWANLSQLFLIWTFTITAVYLGVRNVSSQLMVLVWTLELKCFLKYYIEPDSIQ